MADKAIHELRQYRKEKCNDALALQTINIMLPGIIQVNKRYCLGNITINFM